ncbi:transporter substrate-binding domain-containing protein [Noviherbaspirillum sp. 17J57-3]|uniref:Transporter substrate-binding domain-containing protein n=2 Tax=Noviherbaspirillum galbum TaxID=2709383 RepID=A0A6B3SW59_9BURK|nr:transporter substrate-binding domain-containing protein [Noviherbaspirillum galbum]
MLSCSVVAAFLAVIAAVPAAASTITVAWRDKAPYHYIENGVEQGFLLKRARQIFDNAGVPAEFVQEPAKRIWANFAAGAQSYCSIGWYRLPEREAMVQFSEAFHTDPPHTVLVAPNALAQVKAHRTLASLLKDKDLVLGVVDGVSYGPELDAMIKASQNQIDRKTVTPALMTRSVAVSRVSYMFIDRADWEYFNERDDNMRKTIQLDLPDMPQGLNRYITCSKDVPRDVMQRLNKAIDAMNKSKKGA